MILRLLRILEAKYKEIAKSRQRRHPQRDMTEADEEYLKRRLDFSYMAAAENIRMMSGFTARSRELFALKTKSLVLYTPDEATLIKQLEEEVVLRAAPQGYQLKQLNGINVGCGDRRVSDYLTPVDIMRESDQEEASGAHHAFLKDAILANPEDLPFKPASLDYIVALHMLEHVSNPMEILRYWGTLLKPGGGIGLVLPNYEYTWNAAGDHSRLGHKWNANAAIFRRLFEKHLKDQFNLERIGTLPHKISFDVVLRKPGIFHPFAISNATSMHSGAELAGLGLMVSESGD
ncbi:class I SAM-dependent methyltransferase [Ensifer aridi]|uniref:class I SAM-dependent methyltransferase n=1 Tax=Ensifer aridi TaxID=1708715 RepID=UPI000614FE81|nr:class I SAM-dependent methyltransferase [Ensifer aridi]